jgi:hypothetical protein
MSMDKLNEDFTKLYKRWKGGEVRKEDKLDREAVRKFINDNYRYIDENKITMHESCVDYDGDIIITKTDDLGFKFGKVTGNFYASHIDIEDLKFMPKYVCGTLDISHNKLKSFKGCPEEVGGSLIARDCRNLESLEGLPKHIGGNLLITSPNLFGDEYELPEGIVIDGKVNAPIKKKK